MHPQSVADILEVAALLRVASDKRHDQARGTLMVRPSARRAVITSSVTSISVMRGMSPANVFRSESDVSASCLIIAAALAFIKRACSRQKASRSARNTTAQALVIPVWIRRVIAIEWQLLRRLNDRFERRLPLPQILRTFLPET